ncbi:MAG TPA: CsbD family protein [Pseudonocardiaceae bacterium]
MGIFDKAKDKAEQIAGQAKEKLGKASGNEEMEDAGQRDQLSGEAKETGHDLRDKAAGAVDEARERLSNRGDESER